MPKSKAHKKISLTQTVSGGRKLKEELVTTIRDSIDLFQDLYVFSCHNMRTNLFKDLRRELVDCRFFLGKNKVMRLALGRTAAEEYREGLCELGEHLVGNVGLFFTNRPKEEIVAKFAGYTKTDFARSGNTAPKDIELSAGKLPVSHTMLEPLRKLGLPVRLNRGDVELERDHFICHGGDVLTPEQTRLLKLFDHKLALFRITPLLKWHDGKIEKFEDSMES